MEAVGCKGNTGIEGHKETLLGLQAKFQNIKAIKMYEEAPFLISCFNV